MATVKADKTTLSFCVLQREHIDDVVKIHHEAMLSPWSESNWLAVLSPRYVNYVVFLQRKLVGVIVISTAADEAELETVAVDVSCQGLGIARALLGHAVGQLKANRRTNKLFLEVDAKNTRAINLYKYGGFVQIGIRKAYYKKSYGNGDALLMHCMLE